VRERFGKIALIHVDTMEIEANIEHTRFPVPDVNYLRKTSSLFAEFRETGINEKLGFRNPEDLRRA
jgi:hypothetical protein